MDDLLSCSVCCESYHEKHRQPVLLPRCGHSFCRPCISFLVQKGNIICPSCRMDQRVEGADNLPTEFSLLAISLAQQVTKQETCQEHGVKLSFWCKTCNIPACGECLFEDHPMTSHCVIKSTAYVTEMKESVTHITNKFMEALDGREKQFFERIFHSTKMINDALRTITVLRKDMEEARELMKGVKIVEGIGPTRSLSESAKFLGLKWNLQDVNLKLGPLVIKTEAMTKVTAEEPETQGPETESAKDETKDKKEETEKAENATDQNDEAASENGTNESEKADDEKEKNSEEEEEEILTEEEIRKRKKIQKLKERLAAATAAAEQAKQETKEKSGTKKDKADSNKEKKAEDEKTPTPTSSQEAFEATLKSLKPWQKRTRPWEPTPREPSITPERETGPKAKKDTDEKEETEKGTDDTARDEKSKEETTKDDQFKDKADGSDTTDNNTKTGQPDANAAVGDSNKGTNEPAATQVTDNTKTDSPDANTASVTDADSKKEDKVERKASSSSTTKKPRGRLARNALKRAQTMDLSKKLENPDDDTNKEAESENIKGLDLETHKNKANEEVQVKHKEAETQTCEEVNPEENEGATCSTKAAAQSKNGMFEMEPEEKERIATELMQVPSLTICIEGIGGLLARVAWESMGLHIYCHQFQELPYDIIVKSNVLHAIIPTKDPMVFLDIGSDDHMLGRVYIKLWGHLRRANNMLLLCLGDKGRSLRNSRFFKVMNADGPGERLLGGDYEYNDGRGGEALIDDLEYQGKYSMPMEMGLITSATGGNRSMDSQFYICTEEDLNRQFACPFGRVFVGLPILKEAVWISVTTPIYIQDCGVVLDCPRM